MALAQAALVFAGGAGGAAARHGVGRLAGRWTVGVSWPVGTFAVNMAGSFVLGGLVAWSGHGLGSGAQLLLATGVCGGFTTFSSLSYESVRLAEQGLWRQAVANPLISLVLGFGAFALGWALLQGAGL